MGFKEAVRTCLKEKYITFSGRASRSEYWYFILFYFLVSLGVGLLFFVFGGSAQFDNTSSGFSGVFAVFGIIYFLFAIGTFLPMIAVVVRRFHDVNLSGWWYLGGIIAGVIPFVGILATIAIVVVTVLKGTSGANKFGPDPLVEANSAEVFA